MIDRACCWTLVALGLMGVWLALGCEHSCTDLGCRSGFDVTIAAASKLEAGTYLLDITTPFESGTLTCQLEGQNPLACSCASTPTTLSGCVTAAGVSVFVGGKPSAVSLRLTREGAELGTWSYTPQYETHHPNGESCDPACDVAHASGTL